MSVCVNVLIRNGDAHLKNFGVIYTNPAANDVRLSPMYDLICTTLELPKDVMALSLAKTKAWPNRAALIEFGRKSCFVDHPEQSLNALIDRAANFEPDPFDLGPATKLMSILHSSIRKLSSHSLRVGKRRQ